ncbi:hypothetical protein HPB52_018285 [Rhipicephalus sanguineus]|uniref:snRNA-activating protein complex subunit 3 n=1 Tax=Rhipicephalus sanguineus TaxID=34632 RepID=A0A9D4Q1N6_RHISA|nr:hypothetical protein HPB52_018285 [Rhipicephalus sanguineus]
MDSIHEPENRPWIGEVMSPVDFKRKWTDALKNEQQADDQKMREALMKIMNVPDAVLKTIEADCSPSTLCCGEESMDTAKLPNHDDLVTLRQVHMLQRQDLEKRKSDEAYRMKMFHHFRKICFLSKVELYKSGFFYIGNTFYNDMSDPSCRDYSEVIIKWAKDPRREIGPFNVADMEDTKLSDLELRLGYPYVYVHQGYCEHLVVFSDMRMLHPHDSQCISDYPIALKTFPCGKRVFCMLCHQNTAKWVTYENERVLCDPYFFCDACFRSYNYTANHKKIGKFRAAPFLDWNTVI